MESEVAIVDYTSDYQSSIRKILQQIGWAEQFALAKKARGIYVDTPTLNTGGRSFYEAAGYQLGYIMPRYYEDEMDGVTYQKFWRAYEPDEHGKTHACRLASSEK
ncbi:MAG TPA: hypothetical protein VFQ23_25070 [Anaerolineales bacterium]|nr:hypothetical protein [Anaerolineales bacterium]